MIANSVNDLVQQAMASQNAGRLADAERLYRQVLSQQPNHSYAMHNLGIVCQMSGKADEALRLMARSVKLEPSDPHFRLNLATAYRLSGKVNDAHDALKALLAQWPKDPLAHQEMGLVYDKKGQYREAIAEYREALALLPREPATDHHRPLIARALANLGSAHFALSEYEEAQQAALEATRIRPDYALAHMNRADALFRLKRIDEAWHEYEWRWKRENFTQKWPDYPQPLWDGSELNGKSVLLWHEQGLGDTVQFCRYAPLVAQRGGRPIVLCQPELKRLLQSLPSSVTLVANTDARIDFDVHVPLMSLPRIFNTSLKSIPSAGGYLSVDPAIVDGWRQRIMGSDTDPRYRVGLVWAGAPTHVNDHNRSIPFEHLAALLEITGIQFFSLQKGAAADQLRQSAWRDRVIDWSDEFTDYAATAGLIANLDLVIAVDTSAVHVAGAIGRNVWTLLPFDPDFRYVYDEEQSSWYTSMRLFRQPSRGDWPGLLKRVEHMLRQRAA